MTKMTPEQEVKVKAATTWIPLTLVCSVVVFAVVAAWQLSNERNNLYGRIGETDGKITQVSNDLRSLAETVRALASAVGKPNLGNITREQLVIDCLRTQIMNKDWKCLYAIPQFETSIQPYLPGGG
jgi:hypothetical protein